MASLEGCRDIELSGNIVVGISKYGKYSILLLVW